MRTFSDKQAIQGLTREVADARKCMHCSSRLFFHVPIPIYASRQLSPSTPRSFPSASTGFPAQQAEGSAVHVEVEEVQQEVKQEVEEDVKVEEDMQQHITIVLQRPR